MVERSIEMIGKIKFSLVFSNVKQFSFSMNDVLSETDISETVIIQIKLPQPRIRKKKKNFDENYADELINASVVDKLRIEVFQCVVDQLISSLTNRFSTNRNIIADIQYLIAKNLKNQIYLEYCLSTLSDLVVIDRQQLISELHFQISMKIL